MLQPRWLRALLVAAVLGVGGACDVYDAALLRVSGSQPPDALCGNAQLDDGESCDVAIPAGGSGACPTDCSLADPCSPQARTGTECHVQCLVVPVTVARSGDGCCPASVGAAEDSDCGSCGDGIIGPAETCDPPEGCPTAALCKQAGACFVGEFSGDPAQCTARCVLSLTRKCVAGDACCPDVCDTSNDGDCSASCGDGAIEAGETCEPQSAQAPCLESCDDGDPCTSDVLAGTPANCNVQCAHLQINEPVHGDGCCPPGAHNLNDSDCAPVCGNGVTEPAEQCDGGALCTPQCTKTDEGRCLDADTTSANQTCHQCRCQQCTVLMLGCFTNPNATFAQGCRDVIECGQVQQCNGDACYCGTSANCAAPNGPCRSAIDAASAAAGQSAGGCTDDPGCSVYQATAIGQCVSAHCESQCR